MALASFLRRSVASAVPLARRAIGNHLRQDCSTLTTSSANSSSLPRQLCRSLFPACHFMSTKSNFDDSIRKMVESEIKCAEESVDVDQIEATPEDFPFKLEDNPGQQTVSLTREYQGETIKVEVHMSSLITGEEEEDENVDDAHKNNQPNIPLIVSISKTDGPYLEFGCDASPDEISIHSLSVKDPDQSEDQIAYEGPDFLDLDENLQNAFLKYLEIRGIKPSTTNFLQEYMINKDSREYLMWLKNLKKFL
ncbi:uncharacterized protein At2g39795, mitochondrial-like [Impatiens glandulifera]|uniref:uncharacterized protein At2g39795, mitochondrial-like n=1 Tax=Impatiens glandulifera TaxID=253017 RepID=UPI001FB16EB9|nr:uncharacterized protein At2g39795, mitochondrial-like [Impatiens glandulifera]